MRVSVTDAKDQLCDLIRRAEAGDEIVLTDQGRAAVRLIPVERIPSPTDRRVLMEAVRRSAAIRVTAGPSAARSQDDLYLGTTDRKRADD